MLILLIVFFLLMSSWRRRLWTYGLWMRPRSLFWGFPFMMGPRPPHCGPMGGFGPHGPGFGGPMGGPGRGMGRWGL